MTKILSIDPGNSGGAAIFDEARLLDVISFQEPDWEPTLYEALFRYVPQRCIMERVGAMPGQGTRSMFTFGGATRAAETVLKIAGLPIEYVTPQVWQRKLGLPHRREIIGKAKRRAAHRKDQKARALELYPELAGKVKNIANTYSLQPSKVDVYAAVLIGRAAMS